MSRPSLACVMSLLCAAEISTFSPCRPLAASHRLRLAAWLRPSGLVCLHLWDVLPCVELMFSCLDPSADSVCYCPLHLIIVPPVPPLSDSFRAAAQDELEGSSTAGQRACRGVGSTPALQVRQLWWMSYIVQIRSLSLACYALQSSDLAGSFMVQF